MKKCKLCACSKEESAFYVDKSKKTGLSTYCKECSINKRAKTYKNNKPSNKEYMKEYNKLNKEKGQNRNRLYLYNLTSLEYQELRISQLFSCFICGAKEEELARGLFVDHCHKTKKVRGLLCQHCNTLLGMAKDNKDTLEKAIKYLDEYSSIETID